MYCSADRSQPPLQPSTSASVLGFVDVFSSFRCHANNSSMRFLKHLELLPAFIVSVLASFFHLLIAPYTKVEESFTLHAVWDILTYGLDIGKVRPTSSCLKSDRSMTTGNFLVPLNGASFPRCCYHLFHILLTSFQRSTLSLQVLIFQLEMANAQYDSDC